MFGHHLPGVSDEERMKELWYQPSYGFLSAEKFHKRLKDGGYDIPFKKVKAFVSDQSAAQIAWTPKKPKVYNSVVAPYAGANYQMDTMFMTKYTTVNNYSYILVVVDVHSRKMGAAAMKNKSDYTEAFPVIVQNYFTKEGNEVWPASLSCDREYINEEFKQMMEDRGVNIWYSQPDQPNKNAIVERIIRTMRVWFKRWFHESVDGNWVAVLPEFIENYNNLFHSTIKANPSDVWDGVATNNQQQKWVPAQREVGDRVRLVLRKHAKNPFAKSGDRKVSRNIYTIIQRAPKEEGHRQFKWIIARESDHSIVTEGDGETPKRFLDYELIKIGHAHGRPAEEEPAVERIQRGNQVARRLRQQEDLPGEVQRVEIPFTQLGYFPEEGPQRRIEATIELPEALQPTNLKRQSKQTSFYAREQPKKKAKEKQTKKEKPLTLRRRHRNIWPPLK